MNKKFNTEILTELDIREGCCCYCGKKMNYGYNQTNPHCATVEHIIPKCAGGTDSPLNKLPCCRDCNAWKADNSLDYFLDQVIARLTASNGFSTNQIKRWAHMATQISRMIKIIDRYKKEIYSYVKPVRENKKLQQ